MTIRLPLIKEFIISGANESKGIYQPAPSLVVKAMTHFQYGFVTAKCIRGYSYSNHTTAGVGGLGIIGPIWIVANFKKF